MVISLALYTDIPNLVSQIKAGLLAPFSMMITAKLALTKHKNKSFSPKYYLIS